MRKSSGNIFAETTYESGDSFRKPILFYHRVFFVLQNRTVMELKGNGFILREWREEDISYIARNANNIKVWNNLRDYFPHPYTESDGLAFFEVVKGRPYQQEFVIVVGGEAVGNIGFYTQGDDVERFSAEIGYFLGEPYWGRGIMSEAVRLLVDDYIFIHTPIVRVFTAVFDFNAGSKRVLEKAGFRHVGVFRKAAYKNGRFVDEDIYEIVKD